MMDADTFDRCDGNEEAIDAATKRVAKRRIKDLLAVTAMVQAMCGDYFEDGDWKNDWKDNC